RGAARRRLRRLRRDALPLAPEPSRRALRGARAAESPQLRLKESGDMSDAELRTRSGRPAWPPDRDVSQMTLIDFDLTATLDRVAEWQGSDLHLKHGSPPLVRVNGELEPVEDVRPLTPADTERVLWQMLEDPARVAEFESEH